MTIFCDDFPLCQSCRTVLYRLLYSGAFWDLLGDIQWQETRRDWVDVEYLRDSTAVESEDCTDSNEGKKV